MKSFSLVMLTAILFTGCGSYYELQNDANLHYTYSSNHQLLVFSNVFDSARVTDAVKYYSDSLWQKYYVYVGVRMRDIDSMPIKPDSILSLKIGEVGYRVYRYINVEGKDRRDYTGIFYIDVYFENQQVKSIMYSRHSLYIY